MRKRQRLYFILFVLGCLSLAVGLSLYALRENISYFYSPQEVAAYRMAGDPRIAPDKVFRLGGLVLAGSVQTDETTTRISFTVTDGAAEQAVVYKGLLPDLFREGQGVVAMGSLDDGGVFVAKELLAKHDENYMPPEVAKALQDAHEKGLSGMMQGGAP